MTRVAFQGVHGAYSEQAAKEAVPDAETMPAPLLRDAFDAVASGSADLAVVPVENSQAGSINETYDLLLELADVLYVRGEYELRVRHCLLGLPDSTLQEVREAYSHPQALAQTALWLRAHGIQARPHYDTAGAAEWVAQAGNRAAAAVASRAAAEHYRLAVLAEGIEDNSTNRTRFLVIGRTPAASEEGPGKTSLVFSTDHRPGALYRALGCFAQSGINLLKLESRPSRGAGWQYVFYLDCFGWADREPLALAIESLRRETAWVRLLGSYPRTIEPLQVQPEALQQRESPSEQ